MNFIDKLKRLLRKQKVIPKTDQQKSYLYYLKILQKDKIIKKKQPIFGFHKKEKHTGILSTKTGVIFVNGKTFTSLSGAAKSITGGERNGWLWWNISKDGETASFDLLRKIAIGTILSNVAEQLKIDANVSV